MTVEQIRKLHQAQPFKPLMLHLGDGRSFTVRHPETLAILGSGVQARSHADAFAGVREWTEIRIAGRDPAKARRYARTGRRW